LIKISIVFSFTDGPWGGGNQFLKALRRQFIDTDCYEEDPAKAEVILFNSHHKLVDVLAMKIRFPDKIFIHRIDGPVKLIRERSLKTDQRIFKFSKLVADASIYQSKWSLDNCITMGYDSGIPHEVIINAPDPAIFNHKSYKKLCSFPVRLVASSWSPYMSKGFDYYRWLDEYLDFSRYSMTFVGNSPFTYKNIRVHAPCNGKQLASILSEHDIYITASQNDPCSNALLEAMHCGLPAIGLRSGGHPEIIGKAGELFDNNAELLEKIEIVRKDYDHYVSSISLPDIGKVADSYYNFCSKTFLDSQGNPGSKRHLHMKDIMQLIRSQLSDDDISKRDHAQDFLKLLRTLLSKTAN